MRRSRPTCPSSRTGRSADNRPSVSLRWSICCVTPPASPIPRKAIRRGTDASIGVVFRRNLTLADLVTSLVTHTAPARAGRGLGIQPGRRRAGAHRRGRLGPAVRPGSSKTRIFKPLGMVDTGFFVPPDKLSRLVDPIPSGRPRLWDISKPTNLFSGGGGLVSTAPDYLRFCEMLLNGGTLDGVHILSPTTVKQMTTNTLPPDTRFAGEVGQYVGPSSRHGLGPGLCRAHQPGVQPACRAPSAATTGAATGARISGSIRSRGWRWCELIQVAAGCGRLLPGRLAPSDLRRAQRAATAVADRRCPERARSRDSPAPTISACRSARTTGGRQFPRSPSPASASRSLSATRSRCFGRPTTGRPPGPA